MTAKAGFAAFVFLALGAAVTWAQSADVKVSALSDAAPADGTELLYVAQMSAAEGSRSQKLDIDDLSAYVLDLIGLTSASTVCQQDGTGCPAAGAGSVTSVALTVPSFLAVAGSPVTTSGTLAVTLATQAANTVQAGPTTGAAAAPTFRALVATDIPTPLTSSTSGNAGTATALAANGANCSAGSAPRGVDASGAAEDCTAYLTAVTAHATTHEDGGSDEVAIEDLPTACTIGQVVESDGAGGLVCADAGGAVSIADVTSGTTTEDYVIGAGGTLKVTSTGTIDASGIDRDGNGVREISADGTYLNFDPDGDGTSRLRLDGSNNLQTAGNLTFRIGSSFGAGAATVTFTNGTAGVNLIYLAQDNVIAQGTLLTNAGIRPNSETAMDLGGASFGGFNAYRDLYLNRDIVYWNDTAEAESARTDYDSATDRLTHTGFAGGVGVDGATPTFFGAASGALPTCEAATARAVIFDQSGDLCACPPDGSEWYDTSDGLGTPGDCA